jgi:hypothetical protein
MKLPRLKIGDAIEVMWLDSHFQGDGWKGEGDLEADSEFVIRSVCIYIGRDKLYINTVADRCEVEDGVMRDLKIPIGCIKAIRKLQ